MSPTEMHENITFFIQGLHKVPGHLDLLMDCVVNILPPPNLA